MRPSSEDLLQRLLKAGSRQLLASELAAEACSLPGATAVVTARDQSDGRLRLLAVSGRRNPAAPEAGREQPLSLSSWVLSTGECAFCEDLSTDSRGELARKHGFGRGSMLSVPVKASGEAVLAITLFYPRCGDHLLQARPRLESLAETASLVMELQDLRAVAEKQGRQLHALHELSRLLNSAVEPATVLSLGVDVATGLFSLDMCCARVREGDFLRTVAARGRTPDQAADLNRVHLPLQGRYATMGDFVVGRSAGPISDEDKRLLSTWTSLAGVMLENANLLTVANRARQEAESVVLAALEAKLPGSTDLAHATAALAAALSVRLGVPADEVKTIERAAFLMRIGHLVCRQPAAVDHPEAGAALLATIAGLEEVARLIRHQHERWDGTGAPDGLSGESIPMGSRILSAAIAFSGLVRGTERPPLNPVAALISMKGGAGSQFAPEVIAALETEAWSRMRLNPVAGPTADVPPAVGPPPEPPPDLRGLTEREREILEWIAKGCSNREIATALFLSEATVKTHVSRILQKLQLPDRTKAAVYRMRGQRSAGIS